MREDTTKTVKISITISKENCNHIDHYANKIDRSRSKAIDIAVTEYLERNDPNYKHKKILDSYHEDIKK